MNNPIPVQNLPLAERQKSMRAAILALQAQSWAEKLATDTGQTQTENQEENPDFLDEAKAG